MRTERADSRRQRARMHSNTIDAAVRPIAPEGLTRTDLHQSSLRSPQETRRGTAEAYWQNRAPGRQVLVWHVRTKARPLPPHFDREMDV
jgi:hypothetical protein